MGGQGCTIGTDSRAAAVAAGFDDATIDQLITSALTDGTARREGNYIVLERQLCTIRLPDNIASAHTVFSPEIVAITSTVDHFAADGVSGCFLIDPIDVFEAMKGGKTGAGFGEYLNFVAASLMSGDLRYYGPSPLATPPGFQVVNGDCAEVAGIEAIRANHFYLTKGFGEYIRQLGERTSCTDPKSARIWEDALAEMLQGVDPTGPIEMRPEHNAWLYMEYKMITYAAGWHEGMSSSRKGEPRPPLCHYPRQM